MDTTRKKKGIHPEDLIIIYIYKKNTLNGLFQTLTE